MNTDSKVAEALGVAEENRLLQGQLQGLQQQLAQSQQRATTWERRYQALEAYTSGLTHQCLSSNRALEIIAQKLHSGGGEHTLALQPHLDKLRDLSDRNRRLSEALLEGARAWAGGRNLEPLCLNDLLGRVRDEHRLLIKESRAHLERTALPRLLGDRQQWSTLFSQLLSNALLYREGSPRISVEVASDIDGHHFLIEDNGQGVPAPYREVVFSPFRRLHTAEESPGVGLGLTVCREIVTRLGGRIWLADNHRQGRGVAVHFTVKRQALM